jgi:hypothetical protein
MALKLKEQTSHGQFQALKLALTSTFCNTSYDLNFNLGILFIFPSAMEVVRSLKNILENNNDEIYATLKECNMDLYETAQRLFN